MFTPANIVAALLTLTPFFLAAFSPATLPRVATQLPRLLRLIVPTLLAIPYLLVTLSSGTFHWGWFALYLLLPPAIAASLYYARDIDPSQHGTAIDLFVLALVGLAVDLRWFEAAWPRHLAIFNKILLLDAGIYGFLAIRQLTGVGFDLRLRPRDWQIGLREFAIYTPIAILLGLALGFLHVHPHAPWLRQLPVAWIFTFLFVAVPEELFFRGWLQNLLERRTGRTPALCITAALFGLAHFNKRAAHFNWRYVLLAAIAGIFYGRAWRQERRVGASAITHASVDSIWSVWLR
jgi:membrane protease YdiL (CAAX protease family)